jgi:N-glycosylase/DNA lyase
MNNEEKLEKKKEKLQRIKNALEEGIYSQEKYLEYVEKETKLEKDIKNLQQPNKEEKSTKIWIDMGNGWKKRINKND